MTYVIEGDAPLVQYTPGQLGEFISMPFHARRKDCFDLIVIDNSITQVIVMDACPWDQCRARVQQMVRYGIDPFDIRGIRRKRGARPGEEPRYGLEHVQYFLWWDILDEKRLNEELAEAGADALPGSDYFARFAATSETNQ